MSGELQVVFIYDTLRCRKEEDDPTDAILYFHPEEIPEIRRLAICGQLMGMTQFLVELFSPPKIISLENGKFALKELGKQYILALGCSSVTPDWLLEKQAEILYEITKFFHKDIDSILRLVGKDALTEKLTNIMDHYIPISQHHGDLFALSFGILPILSLPKSASHISLSATLLLQTCLLKDGVLGGIVMFQNKVIAVELIQDLARKLAFIQPYQLPPADMVRTSFNLPPGVQLLKVYLKRGDLDEIRNHSSSYQYPSRFSGNANGPNGKDTRMKNKIDAIREEDQQDPSDINFSLSDYSKSQNNGDHQRCSGISGGKNSQVLPSDESASPAQGSHKNNSIFHPTRLFHSLENLAIHHQSEDDTEIRPEIKRFSTSLTDPLFPYLRCDGKNISKCYLDANAYPNPDRCNEDDGEEFMTGKASLDTKTLKSKPHEDSSESENEKYNNGAGKMENNLENVSPTSTPLEGDVGLVKLSLDLKSKANSGITRPKDLALNCPTRHKTKRRWSTFEDMMSPLLETPLPLEVQIPNNVREKSASISVTDTGFLMNTLGNPENHDASFKTSLFNSFRKLGSSATDDLSVEDLKHGSISNQIDNKLNNKFVHSPDIPWNRPWAPFSGKIKSICTDPDIYEDAVLFIYSLGGMRLLLLLEKESSNNRELIQTLRDYGSNSIAELEVAVSNIEEQGMSMGAGHHDRYCYLHYEPVWRSLAYGGRNHSMDFEMVQHMHQDFHTNPNINELIIRGDDHVVYGYQCVGSEVFYQQSAVPQPGLPMPSDLMGKVPIKAKRRLERDHNILLL